MHRTAMFEDGRALGKRLAAAVARKVAPLKVHRAEVAILGGDVSKSGPALCARKRLELVVRGAHVQAQVRCACETRPARVAHVLFGSKGSGRGR